MSKENKFTNVKIADVMTKDVHSLPMTATIGDAIKAFSTYRVSGFPIVDDNQVVAAYLSDGDIIHYIIYHFGSRNMKRDEFWQQMSDEEMMKNIEAVANESIIECASRHVRYAEPDDSVRHIAQVMNRKRLKYMPVTEDGVLVGIVSRNALLQHLFEEYSK